jgi:hypothetical protein
VPVIKPALDTTGPENVVVPMRITSLQENAT